MKKFFVDKIRRLRDSVPSVITDPLIKMKEAMSSRRCSFVLKHVSEEDVLKVMKNILQLQELTTLIP
jgi:replication-associated recombination protein RarA